MSERFNDVAREIVTGAHQEAELHGHGYLSTEHILAAIANVPPERCVASNALASIGAGAESILRMIDDIIGHSSGRTSDQVHMTPRAKKVLELSLREMLNNNDDYIGSGHILLGLFREGEGVGAQVISKHDPQQLTRVRTVELINRLGMSEIDPVRVAERDLSSRAIVRRLGNQHGLFLEVKFGPYSTIDDRELAEQAIRNRLGIT